MADSGGSSSSCYEPCLDTPAVLKLKISQLFILWILQKYLTSTKCMSYTIRVLSCFSSDRMSLSSLRCSSSNGGKPKALFRGILFGPGFHSAGISLCRNKHIMIDLGTGNNNKINWAMEDKQEMIDIIETVYRGARKGRGLVVSPKDYSTKYRY
ncbi:thioredoxin-like protein 4A isoform X1 [Vicugna pacos]|uniref:Thioredoxin-like protein 4A isoform X1 n=1 Tax=Vicugna pacos TaxID=30538 RepID=A0A6J3A207_VICPA|nr:thioredoxin-like protein 4A isoform X3 [Vicugna pacos]